MTGDGPFFSDRPSPIEWPSSEVTRHDWRVERGCASKGCPGVPMIEGKRGRIENRLRSDRGR